MLLNCSQGACKVKVLQEALQRCDQQKVAFIWRIKTKCLMWAVQHLMLRYTGNQLLY